MCVKKIRVQEMTLPNNRQNSVPCKVLNKIVQSKSWFDQNNHKHYSMIDALWCSIPLCYRLSNIIP